MIHQASRLAWALSFVLAIPIAPAWACSTCKCGDPTISLLGSEKAFSGRLRLGLDFFWHEERQGPASAASYRRVQEQRRVLGLAYSPSNQLSLSLRLPHVSKQLTRGDLSQEKARGWGDADLSARWRLWKSGPMSGRHLAGVQLGVRLPTSEQLKDGRGRVLDIDVQPDARAMAPNLGGWYAYHRFPWYVAVSASHFHFEDGQQGFAPGPATVASLLAQYALHPRVALLAGLDARHSQRNRYADVPDRDSGGSLLMGRLGIALRIGSELIVGLSAQLPAIDQLNGRQEELPNARFSLAYDF